LRQFTFCKEIGEHLEPVQTEPASRSDSAAQGILIGLGIGFASAFACVFLFILVWGNHDAFLAVPFLVPPVSVAVFGVNARRNKKSKYAAGLFIAAAVVALLEGTCAYQWFR
jgi:uncharacterized membrane protein